MISVWVAPAGTSRHRRLTDMTQRFCCLGPGCQNLTAQYSSMSACYKQCLLQYSYSVHCVVLSNVCKLARQSYKLRVQLGSQMLHEGRDSHHAYDEDRASKSCPVPRHAEPYSAVSLLLISSDYDAQHLVLQVPALRHSASRSEGSGKYETPRSKAVANQKYLFASARV